MSLLEVQDLHTSFFTDAGEVKAVNGVSFFLDKGKVLGIVGESGSGKSVTAYSIMQILASTGKIVSGSIKLDGQELVGAGEDVMKHVRGNKVSIIFQDPMTSLNPTYTIGHQLMEAITLHTDRNRKQAWDRAVEMLRLVNVNEPEKRMKQYPYEFSGGMRQRVAIAIAVACNPKILICDEPTTALDVTIQAQIIRLISDMQKKYNLTVIYITHDLGVVAKVADRVAVMYAGDIVEIGTCREVFYDPKHPYTWALLASMPQLGVRGEKLSSIHGTPPNLFQPLKGDAFAPRNPYALKIDFEYRPPYFEVTPTHKAKTWLLSDRAPKIDPPEAIRNIKNLVPLGGDLHDL